MNALLDGTLRALPQRPGVYVFRDRRAKALYVGRAAQLRRRVRSYWGLLDDRRHLRRMIPRIAAIEHTVCDTEHAAAFMERDLITRLDPPFNRIVGVEVEVYIRLREDGALHVVHDTLETKARHFGPYLGGRAVHDAAIGLRALYPLEPSSRAMAAARGFSDVDDATVRDRLVALLEGDRDELAAASARLHAMRDAASERLAFEYAADVQTRIAALAWISEAPCASPRRPG
jgi:excinuclease ABC subunit C